MKRNKYKVENQYGILSIICFALIVLFSCDMIDPPYKEENYVPIESNQVVLIEEYTGFTCGNCPPAAEEAHRLKDRDSGNVIVLTVHAGTYAEPSEKHPYDFRTIVAAELNDFFKINKYPVGMVNRVVDPESGRQNFSRSNWEKYVNAELKKEARLGLRVGTQYNATTKRIDIEVNVEYFTKGTKDHFLAVYVVEDSIVQYQLDYRKTPSDIYNYVHNYVLRDEVNGTFGESLSNSDINTGERFTKNYSYVIAEDKDWRPRHIWILAYVHDKGNSYQILQSAQAFLYPKQ